MPDHPPRPHEVNHPGTLFFASRRIAAVCIFALQIFCAALGLSAATADDTDKNKPVIDAFSPHCV
ncbi:MAG: hypothetical protein ABI318_13140, partial [Chthoniobacteraceae bacterium]